MADLTAKPSFYFQIKDLLSAELKCYPERIKYCPHIKNTVRKRYFTVREQSSS